MIECLLRPSVAVHSGSGASQTFNGKKLFYFPFFPSSSSRLHRTFSSSTPYHRSEPSPSYLPRVLCRFNQVYVRSPHNLGFSTLSRDWSPSSSGIILTNFFWSLPKTFASLKSDTQRGARYPSFGRTTFCQSHHIFFVPLLSAFVHKGQDSVRFCDCLHNSAIICAQMARIVTICTLDYILKCKIWPVYINK